MLVVRGQAVDARRDHALDGVGDLQVLHAFSGDDAVALHDQQAAVDERAQQFLEEERVAFRLLEDRAARGRREVLHAQEVLHQFAAVVVA